MVIRLSDNQQLGQKRNYRTILPVLQRFRKKESNLLSFSTKEEQNTSILRITSPL
jgi:hypothetical protein